MMMNDDEVGENAIETERRRLLEFRRQIVFNDPSLVQVAIGVGQVAIGDVTMEDLCYIPHDGDWGEFGESIGRNTFIKKIIIDIDQED